MLRSPNFIFIQSGLHTPSKHLNQSLYYFTAAVFLALLLPPLFQTGVFMDGIIYSSVSRNMAQGLGSFWQPVFSQTLLSEFHDQPPLAIGLQSLFFKVLGDHFYIERLYCFVIALLSAAILISLYRKVTKDTVFSWLPVLLWISTDRVFWCFNQNMLENTMCFFALCSVLVFYLSLDKTKTPRVLFQTGAAILLLFGFLSKGLPALFPLGFYFFHFLSAPSKKQFVSMLRDTFITLLIFFCLIFLLFLYEPAGNSIKAYLQQQVIQSVKGNDRVGSRIDFISGIFQQLALMLGLTFVLIIIARKNIVASLKNIHGEGILLFLYLGLGALLPLLVSPKLSFYYMVPSFPYFAIFFALICQHQLKSFFNKGNRINTGHKIFRVICLLSITSVVVYSVTLAGTNNRDGVLINDVEEIKRLLPPQSAVCLSPELSEDWTLIAYLQRNAGISVYKSELGSVYLLQKKDEPEITGYELLYSGKAETKLSRKKEIQ